MKVPWDYDLISIFASVPPMMWVPAQRRSVYYGSEVELICVVEAHPEALTYWEFNGELVQESNDITMREISGPPNYKVINYLQ